MTKNRCSGILSLLPGVPASLPPQPEGKPLKSPQTAGLLGGQTLGRVVGEELVQPHQEPHLAAPAEVEREHNLRVGERHAAPPRLRPERGGASVANSGHDECIPPAPDG